jgi:hypothetical protein
VPKASVSQQCWSGTLSSAIFINEGLLVTIALPKAAILLSLRVFGCLPNTVGRAPMAGVRKTSREETAGKLATALMRAYEDLGTAMEGFLISRMGAKAGWRVWSVFIDRQASPTELLCRQNYVPAPGEGRFGGCWASATAPSPSLQCGVGSGTPSSWRACAMLSARLPLANRP